MKATLTLSNRGVVPACRSIDCVSIFAPTVADAVDVMLAAAGHDPLDPGSRRTVLDASFFPVNFRFGVPAAEDLEFYGDDDARRAFDAIEGGRGCERILDRLATIAREIPTHRRRSGLGQDARRAPLS